MDGQEVVSVCHRTGIKCRNAPQTGYRIRGCFKIEGQFPRTWMRKGVTSDSIWAAQGNKAVSGCGLPFVCCVLVLVLYLLIHCSVFSLRTLCASAGCEYSG